MCRYAMALYKPHYACFNCRKAFKRSLMWDLKKEDKTAWKHIKTLYSVGVTFHSCGCSGPGYIPGNREALMVYLECRLQEYKSQLRAIDTDDAKNFWIGRIKEVEQNIAKIKSATSSHKTAN